MNKDLLKDTKEAYAAYRAILVRDILRVPMAYPDNVCAPTKITIAGIPTKASEAKTHKVTFKVEKLGTIGEVEASKPKDGIQIVDVAPSSLLTAGEAEDLLMRQKDGVINIRQTDGVEICTRGTAFHEEVVNALCGKTTPPEIPVKSLRKILSYILGSTEYSPRLLYLLLTKLENEADNTWEKPLPQYVKKGSLLGDSPIKTDKTIRAIRFGVNVGYAEEQNLLLKLSGQNSTCLKDFLTENYKDCEAADKFRFKSGVAKINCYQTMLTEAIKIYRGAFGHRSYR